MAMEKEGVSKDAAIKRIWMVDSKGLIVKVIQISYSFKYHDSYLQSVDTGKTILFMKATTTVYLDIASCFSFLKCIK